MVHTRGGISGVRSGVESGGGGVALRRELLSGLSVLPESAPLLSYGFGFDVRVWRYTEALAALPQVVANADDDPSEVVLHLLRIGAATTLAAGSEVRGPPSEKVDGTPQNLPRYTSAMTHRTRVLYLVN